MNNLLKLVCLDNVHDVKNVIVYLCDVKFRQIQYKDKSGIRYVLKLIQTKIAPTDFMILKKWICSLFITFSTDDENGTPSMMKIENAASCCRVQTDLLIVTRYEHDS